MTNTTPIILDRLSDALSAQGVTLKRNQLLKIAASAFGYRNTNAFSAAAKNGEIEAMTPDNLGTDDRGLTVLRDTETGSVFAIDQQPPESCAQQWCLSPYGGIIDVSKMSHAKPIGITVHTAIVSHKHGTNFIVANTASDLNAQIAGYCEEWWDDARNQDDDLPETTEGMSDEDIISSYFEAMENEYVEKGVDTLTAPAAVAMALATTTGEAWAVSRTSTEGDKSVLWWSDADGWGDLASASVYVDQSGRLPMAGQDDARVIWERLPTAYVNRDDRLASHSKAEQAVGAEWTRADGSSAERDAIGAVKEKGIQAASGLHFDHMEVQCSLDSRYDSGARKRIVLRTTGDYNQEAARVWREAVEPTLTRAGALAITITDNQAIVILDGDADIAVAESTKDWLRAMQDIFSPIDGRERILANFRPEVWINDNAVEVDAEGPKAFDVTYEMLLLGRDAASQLCSGDCDYLKEAIRSPEWIANWTGPFTITVSLGTDD